MSKQTKSAFFFFSSPSHSDFCSFSLCVCVYSLKSHLFSLNAVWLSARCAHLHWSKINKYDKSMVIYSPVCTWCDRLIHSNTINYTNLLTIIFRDMRNNRSLWVCVDSVRLRCARVAYLYICVCAVLQTFVVSITLQVCASHHFNLHLFVKMKIRPKDKLIEQKSI